MAKCEIARCKDNAVVPRVIIGAIKLKLRLCQRHFDGLNSHIAAVNAYDDYMGSYYYGGFHVTKKDLLRVLAGR